MLVEMDQQQDVVAVPEQQMVNILKKLSPGAKIVISKDMSSISKY